MWKKEQSVSVNFSTDSFFAYSLPSRFRERIILSFLSVAAALAAVLQASVLLATATAPHFFPRLCDLADFYDPRRRKRKRTNKIVFRAKIVFIFKLKLVLSLSLSLSLSVSDIKFCCGTYFKCVKKKNWNCL